MDTKIKIWNIKKYFLQICIFFSLLMNIWLMLHVDLWQSRQSRIYEAGCSCCINKVITRKQAMCGCKQLTWVDNRNTWALEIYIYTGTHVRWSHNQVRAEAALSATRGRGSSNPCWEAEVLMAQHCWENMGQYSSPLSVLLSLSLSLTYAKFWSSWEE